jgi:hypothetical protein
VQTLRVDLENCYGIKKLQAEFDFAAHEAYAIYAPNGAMKSSLAQTFKDFAESVPSKDRIFTGRRCSREITDENDAELANDNVFVIFPYEGSFDSSERVSTLLVDTKLRSEYEKLHREIDQSKDNFLKAIREQSRSKRDLEPEISSAFTAGADQFDRALVRIQKEVLADNEAPFKDVEYDKVFDEKVLSFLDKKESRVAIENYIKKYNELLAGSTYFKKGVFTYYNASTIAKSLADNGFFNAKHTVTLNAEANKEIKSEKELEELITKEKESILNDKDLKKQFATIEKLIQKNADLRAFEAYLADHDEILARLGNVDSLREDVFKSYFKARVDLFKDLLEKYEAAEESEKKIKDAAARQRTQWEFVIDVFNSRFFVPFKLTVKNRESVILGQEPLPTLAFTYQDGKETAPIEKSELMAVLSTGEKKALYVLNIIFEVQARIMARRETLFVVDDIADSFDYKNKYAIIQYLMDIREESYFRQIILTHNFDFFRTICKRLVDYSACLMAVRNDDGIVLKQATGIKNVFVNDWKGNFFTDTKKRIASIPFIRNIVEYTKGEGAVEFKKLTSLLHWKSDSAAITNADLDEIYNAVFNEKGVSKTPAAAVVDTVCEEAQNCLQGDDGVNFENKIVLSIAIRIIAERFMVAKINDAAFVAGIDSNQTYKLLERFKFAFKTELASIEVLQRVLLMTPENIHVNSFMYEPILDMSDNHLRKLHEDVSALK